MSRLIERERKPVAIVVGPPAWGTLSHEVLEQADKVAVAEGAIGGGHSTDGFVIFGLPVELDYNIEGLYVRAEALGALDG
jgi:hypothetical protein